MTDLIQVIDEMVNGSLTQVTLSRGLRLQYKGPDNYAESYRLMVYRVDWRPSDRELAIVRRQLEMLLPGRDIDLGREFEYQGSDGRSRICRVFSWQIAIEQQALFDAPAPLIYTEAE